MVGSIAIHSATLIRSIHNDLGNYPLLVVECRGGNVKLGVGGLDHDAVVAAFSRSSVKGFFARKSVSSNEAVIVYGFDIENSRGFQVNEEYGLISFLGKCSPASPYFEDPSAQVIEQVRSYNSYIQKTS